MTSIRVVSYAINGRGMGHLVRQLAILRWVRRITAVLDVRCECWVLTSSEADTLARREGVPALKMPSKAMVRDAGLDPTRYLGVARTWVLNAVAGLKPDLLLVDTFAGGSFGELVASLELARRRVLVARRVKEEFGAEDPYRGLLPLYDHVIVPDDRGTGPILIRERSELLPRADARAALGIPDGARAVYVTLGGGGDAAAAATLPDLVPRLVARGWHVVVGAGPLYDGPERRGPGITWIDRYVPVELLTGVDAAVSAGGYNTYHELMFVGVPTVFLPQPRIADDQAERAARAEAAGAGRVARDLTEVPDLLDAVGDADAARALVPHNGARAAAVAALSTLLPAEDLALAGELLSPKLLEQLFAADRIGRGGNDPRPTLELVRLLAGGSPTDRARRRATLLELADRGFDVPPEPTETTTPGGRVHAFFELVAQLGVPTDVATKLARALARKFPAATPDDLVGACATLLPVWARFDDWMGVVSLLRAVPIQRGYALRDFAAACAAWLANADDLFDALREFSRLENAGDRPVSEVLRLLARGPEPAG